MKMFAYLLLSVALSNLSPTLSYAQGIMTVGRKNLTAATARVKDFFLPSAGRYSGLQNVIAGITIAGMTCVGLNGCAVKYKEEKRQSVQFVQNVGVYGGLLAVPVSGIVYASAAESGTKEQEERASYFFFASVGMLLTSSFWKASTFYVSPDGRVYPGPGILDEWTAHNTNETNDIELRNYLREHLTSATYRHLFANSSYEDGLLAVPTNAELFNANKDDPLVGLVTSLEQADTIYYGHMREPAVVTLNALKHRADADVQLLAEELVLSVIVPTE